MKLTLQMIDRDGYGGNLTGKYSYHKEFTIQYKAKEYCRLSEDNTADVHQLIREYRRRKLGVWKAWEMNLLERLMNLGHRCRNRLDVLQGSTESESDELAF